MTLFEQIIAEILIEDVSPGKVNDAIDRTYEVIINYNAVEDDMASGKRRIQPVAYGITKAGNPVIRAYQPEGDTKTRVPAWKMFRLDGIESWKPMYKKVFEEPPGYNPLGDKTMAEVYNKAIFGNPLNVGQDKTQEVPVEPAEKPKQEKPASHMAADHPEVKKLDSLRRQLENPRYVSGVVKTKEQPAKEPDTAPAQTGPVMQQAPEKKHYNVQDHPEVQKANKLLKQLDNPRYISDIMGTGKEPQKAERNGDTGPVMQNTADDNTFKTQTERDIESRRQQFNKGERVPQSVLDQWRREQEKRKNKR